MHNLSTGAYAKNTPSTVNPRVVLRDIIEGDMKADRTAHFNKFADKLFDGIDRADLEDEASDLLSAVVNSWFSVQYPTVVQDAEDRMLTKLKNGNKKQQAQAAKIQKKRADAQADRQQKKQAIAAQVVTQTNQKLAKTASGLRTIMLLDTVTLPNGKKLRDATGADCGKAGGMLSRIGLEMTQRGVVNGLVGDNFTEKQIQKILAGV